MTLRLPTTVAAVTAELDAWPHRGDAAALSHLMEFDHPVTVHPDGSITDGPAGVYAPDLRDGHLTPGWSLLDGYSGQQSYSGPEMHPSEFIGGRMARDILAEPGTYVAIGAYNSCETCGGSGIVFVTDDNSVDSEADCPDCEAGDDLDGWAVAKLDADR